MIFCSCSRLVVLCLLLFEIKKRANQGQRAENANPDCRETNSYRTEDNSYSNNGGICGFTRFTVIKVPQKERSYPIN